MSYTHLSQDERYQIQWLRRAGFSLDDIGAEVQRSASTVSRELHRNLASSGNFDSRYAQRQTVKRRHSASARVGIGPECWAKVEARLREDWSPDQIAGEGEIAISHERI